MCKTAAQIAYIRVSTAEQNTERQFEGMDFDKVFEDHCSGKDTNRPAFRECLDFMREGDTLNVWSIDRLARNLVDLEGIITTLTARGVAVRFHKENMTFSGDTASPMNTLLMQVLGSFAQFERSMIRERQREGIAAAKERGVYSGANHKGRKAVCTDEQLEGIRSRIDAGEKVAAIAEELGVSRQAVYKMLRQA